MKFGEGYPVSAGGLGVSLLKLSDGAEVCASIFRDSREVPDAQLPEDASEVCHSSFF